MKKYRVLLVDDHRLFCEGLEGILNSQDDFSVIGEAEDGLEALIKSRALEPDLVVMDVAMPLMDGLEATRRIKQELPDTVIVMLTVQDDDEKLFQAIRYGAQGYLLKTIRAQEMLAMLRGAVHGEAAITPTMGGHMLEEFRRVSRQVGERTVQEESSLTGREQEVLSLVAEGSTNLEIAHNLNISIHTVKSHMRKILAKLHLEGRKEAAAVAQRQGLIPPL